MKPMDEIAIKIENLSKKYYVGKQLKPDATLITRAAQAFVGPARRVWKLARGQQTGAAELDEQFWALKDVNFVVKRGEVVGIIGQNGAGKSTLLKLLSRITYPTEGRIAINGRVGSLLEVGTGFHDELTGRENIYLNGTILGMTRREVVSKFDEIVAFAGVERFLDTPVKHYSSGMKVRLAFAVAAHLEPEILLIDEVLSVGDTEFQKKSIGKMNDVAQSGRTVLFVSHNLAAVRDLCDRAILLEKGQVIIDGHVETTLDRYLGNVQSENGEIVWEKGIANTGVEEFSLYAARIRNHRGEITSTIDFTQSYTIELEYSIHEVLPRLRVGFRVLTASGVIVMAPFDVDNAQYHDKRQPGLYISRCEIPGHLLMPGEYYISVGAGIIKQKHLCKIERALSLSILSTSRKDPNERFERRPGIILPNLNWHIAASERIRSSEVNRNTEY